MVSAPLQTFIKSITPGFKLTAPKGLAPIGLGEKITSFLASFGKSGVAKVLPRKSLTFPRISGGTKALAGTAIVTTGATLSVLETQRFLETEEGQRTLDVVDDSIERLTGGFGDSFEFFTNNPIILPLIIGLGILLVIKK